jgi:hypothetical protein
MSDGPDGKASYDGICRRLEAIGRQDLTQKVRQRSQEGCPIWVAICENVPVEVLLTAASLVVVPGRTEKEPVPKQREGCEQGEAR